jgi:hypothetical protein
MAGREGLAEDGLDAAQGGAAHDPGEEVPAAGEARADCLSQQAAAQVCEAIDSVGAQRERV